MKWIFIALIVIVGFMYVSKVNIQFNPFKISFGDITYGFGWLFILLAVICFQLSGYRTGNIEGYKEALQDVLNEAKKEQLVSDK